MFGQSVNDFIQRLTHNAFLSTFDPKLDVLWERLRYFYASKCSIKSPLDHYISLIKTANEEEIGILVRAWEELSCDSKTQGELIQAVRKLFYDFHSVHFCYSYLRKKERDKIAANLPELNQVFQIQGDIEGFFAFCLHQVALVSIDDNSWLQHLRAYACIDLIEREGTGGQQNDNAIELVLQNIFPLNNNHLLVLQRSLLNAEDLSETLSNQVLRSDYDGNGPNSQEIPYRHNTFSLTSPILRKKEENVLYPLLSKPPTSEQRLTALLYFLRISPESQVITILSELEHHQTWLIDKESESYIVLSLFQPGCLLSALRSEGDVWLILKNLWARNKETHPHAASFILQLADLISGYALDAQEQNLISESEETHTQALSWQKEVLAQANLMLAQADLNPGEANKWHYKRVSALVRLGLFVNSIEEANCLVAPLVESSYTRVNTPVLGDASSCTSSFSASFRRCLLNTTEESFIQSYWFCTIYFNQLSSKEAECIRHVLERAHALLLTIDDFVTKSQRVIERLSVFETTKQFASLVELPKRSNKGQVQIDIAKRIILIDNGEVNFIPQSIRNSQEYRELFGDQQFLARKQVTPHHLVYEWSLNKQRYRVRCTPWFEEMIVQHQEGNSWWTYAAPSKALSVVLGLSQFAFTAAPPLLNQKHYRVWFADRSNWQVIDITTQQVLYSQTNNQCIVGNPDEHLSCNWFAIQTDIPELLHYFEAKQFILTINSGCNTIWRLERYGLEFITGTSAYTLQTKDKRYEVHSPVDVGLNLFGSGLVFKDLQQGKKFLVIPIQPYIGLVDKNKQAIKNPNNTFYYLRHDFSNQVISRDLEIQADLGWIYTNSERYVMYPLSDKGEPTATSAHDQVYLAHLYLVQNRPKKALNCLRNGVLFATLDVMKRLWQIIEKLPDGINAIQNSRVIAVQLTALYLMLQMKKQTPNWHKVLEKR